MDTNVNGLVFFDSFSGTSAPRHIFSKCIFIGLPEHATFRSGNSACSFKRKSVCYFHKSVVLPDQLIER